MHEEYGEDRPLVSYAALMATYVAGVAGMGAYVKGRAKPLPERLSYRDLALLALATQRLSRMVAKDPVTSPLRSFFTRYQGLSAPAELHEEVRGHGLQKAIGELLTCPFCLAQWTATLGVFGLVVAPRATRLAADVL
ncbi:MAG TPA: DUF1360 domain-containing protein, partial [Acidimicrobiales bacterium]|nr:DUF1360 domain-containing protein [Acidimicrobiales bacterium]